jgi:FolB domain-containing protein
LKAELSEEWVEIHELRVSTRIGVPVEERRAPQELVISLRYQVSQTFADLGDQIAATVDYGEVARACLTFAEAIETQLLETFVVRVADHLMGKFPFRRLEVEARKFVLPQAAYVSARTGRTRDPVF